MMNLRPVVLVMTSVFTVGGVTMVTGKPLHGHGASPLLHHAALNTAVREVARHAQMTDTDIDVRLMPKVDTKQDELEVCCLHANILDFYLLSVLPRQADVHPRMHQLREDLSRVSVDLKRHGCSITHYTTNPHSLAFSEKLDEMEEGKGFNKAVGEIDILFTYLRDFCVNA